MEKLFKALFGRPKRRMQILMWWNVQQPVEGNTLHDVIKNFITTILYKEIYITLTENEFCVFKNEKGLSIKYETMDNMERNTVALIYKERYKTFENVYQYQSGKWKISKYINKKKKSQRNG